MRFLNRSVVAVFFASLVLVGAAEAQDKKGLAQLSFMVGCWRGDLGEGATLRENHSTPSGGQMMGISQMVAGGETQFFEFIRISEDADGNVAYHPNPGGKESVAFKLVKTSASEAVFENPAHDFPQRITYRLADGKLVARIERMDGDKREEFAMLSVSCTQ